MYFEMMGKTRGLSQCSLVIPPMMWIYALQTDWQMLDKPNDIPKQSIIKFQAAEKTVTKILLWTYNMYKGKTTNDWVEQIWWVGQSTSNKSVFISGFKFVRGITAMRRLETP